MRLSDALGVFFASLPGVVSIATQIFYSRRLPSLLQFFEDIDLASVTTQGLRAWRATLYSSTVRYLGTKREYAGRLSPFTIHQYVRCARRFFGWLVEEGYLATNPAARLELPVLPKTKRRGIPEIDREALLSAASANLRDYAILRILADTGARVGGIANLRLGDLELDRPRPRAVVREKGRGGSGKQRHIYFKPQTLAALRAYLAVRPKVREDYVFLSRKIRSSHRGISTGGIYQMVERYAERLGISQGFNPHNWRHGCIRSWLNNGMPLSKASQLAGHSSVQITGDIYGTSSEEELGEAFERWG